jgi:hypothetical protein
MTLIEVMISMVILAVIMIATLTFMTTLAEGAGLVNQIADIEREGNEIIDRMAESLRTANVQALATAGDDNVSFQVPVDQNNDGDVLGTDLSVQWGGRNEDDTVSLGGSMGFQFVQTGQFSESARNIDLDLDGSTSTTFDLGHIEIVYASGFTQRICGDNIVLVQGDHLADIDGDGDSDPIFWQDGTTIETTLFLTRADEAEPMLVKVTTAVLLRNM